MRRRAALIAATLLLTSACSDDPAGGPGPEPDAAPKPTKQVTVTGVPDQLAAVVGRVYAGGQVPAHRDVGQALAKRFETDDKIRARGKLGVWRKQRVAVVTYKKDVTLAVQSRGRWTVVGGWWPSLGITDPKPSRVRHVLVLGSDARPGQAVERQRADSIHIVGHGATKGASIVGIPRDTYVPIATGGRDKINAALTRGGADGMYRTVQSYAGYPIEGYLITGFTGFWRIVKEIGGVTLLVDVTVPGIKRGLQTLNPGKALDYNRDRKNQPSGDFGRQLNEGKFMIAAVAQAKRAGILKLPKFLTIVGKHTSSNLDAAQMLTFAARAYLMDPAKIGNKVAIGGFGTGPGGASIVVPGAEARALLQDSRDGVFGN